MQEPSLNPEPDPPKAKTSPWLHKYQWTPDRARELQKKGYEVRLRNKAIRDQERLNSVDPGTIIRGQIKVVKAKLDSPRTTASDRKILVSVLKDLFAMLKPDPKPAKPEPSQTGPIKPLV